MANVRQFLADRLAVAQLTTIRRQKDPEFRQAVELVAAGRPDQAIERLVEQKRIIEVSNPTECYRRIAADYLDGYEAHQSCRVVSPAANKERKVLLTRPSARRW